MDSSKVNHKKAAEFKTLPEVSVPKSSGTIYSKLIHKKCSVCGEEYPEETIHESCIACGSPL